MLNLKAKYDNFDAYYLLVAFMILLGLLMMDMLMMMMLGGFLLFSFGIILAQKGSYDVFVSKLDMLVIFGYGFLWWTCYIGAVETWF